MPSVFQILVVCTGNLCRSPQAAQLIRARAAEFSMDFASQLAVESAGTEAMVGSGMPAKAAALSEAHGGDPRDHVARQVSADMIQESDLVLAMGVGHRRALVRLLPRASRYTFTLTEFAALLESTAESIPQVSEDWSALDVPEKLRTGVQWASARRGFLSVEEGDRADVIDPYRRTDKVYEESAHQIVQALDRVQRAAENLSKQPDT